MSLKYLYAIFLTLIVSPLHAAESLQFVNFNPIIVSIMDNNRVIGLLSVTVHTQVTTAEQKDYVEARRPKLQDAFTQKILELGEIYISPDRKIDIAFVNAQLQAVAHAALPNIPLKIYIYDASTRKL
jgi:septum formation inhibitor-activating ATPase MinD